MAFISPSAKRYLPLTTLTPQEKHLPLSTFNSEKLNLRNFNNTMYVLGVYIVSCRGQPLPAATTEAAVHVAWEVL